MSKPKKYRNQAWKNQNGKCIYCSKHMWINGVHKSGKSTLLATTEHIIPKSDGGTNARKNIVCSCKLCNSTRGSISHQTFKEIRKRPNWQQLAREEKWKQLGIYRKKKIEHIFIRLQKKCSFFYNTVKMLKQKRKIVRTIISTYCYQGPGAGK